MHKVSIVIPAYNEEGILKSNLESLLTWLQQQPSLTVEVIIVENGSTDKTLTIAQQLAKRYSQVRVLHLGEASFGKAIQAGLLAARYAETILLNADWIDTDFISLSLRELKVNDIVVGSKVLDPTSDRRPLVRKLLSRLLTFVIKRLFKFRGSDSHGLKAFRTPIVQKLIADCQSLEIIETELLIKAQRSGYMTIEIPVGIEEMRPPRLGLSSRSLTMAVELYKLHKNLRKMRREVERKRAAL